MNKAIVIVGGVVAFFGLAAIFGCHRYGHHGYHHSRTMDAEHLRKGADRIAGRLNMSAEQRERLYALADKIAAELPQYQKTKKEIGDVFLAQFESDTFDSRKVDQVLQKAEGDVSKLRKLTVESAAEFHSILTPEQRKKVVDKWKKYRH